jgi:hypothetical protein
VHAGSTVDRRTADTGERKGTALSEARHVEGRGRDLAPRLVRS